MNVAWVLWFLLFYGAAVVAHELAHVAAARHLRIALSHVHIGWPPLLGLGNWRFGPLPVGEVRPAADQPVDTVAFLLVMSAGPAANFILGFTFLAAATLLFLRQNFGPAFPLYWAGMTQLLVGVVSITIGGDSKHIRDEVRAIRAESGQAPHGLR